MVQFSRPADSLYFQHDYDTEDSVLKMKFTTLMIAITLAYVSPVEPSQPTEYTTASLELAFRPHHLVHRFSPPKGSSGKSVVLDHTSEEAFELLKAANAGCGFLTTLHANSGQLGMQSLVTVSGVVAERLKAQVC